MGGGIEVCIGKLNLRRIRDLVMVMVMVMVVLLLLLLLLVMTVLEVLQRDLRLV